MNGSGNDNEMTRLFITVLQQKRITKVREGEIRKPMTMQKEKPVNRNVKEKKKNYKTKSNGDYQLRIGARHMMEYK